MNPVLFDNSNEKYYRKKDFKEESMKILLENFAKGIVGEYLSTRGEWIDEFPIIEIPGIKGY